MKTKQAGKLKFAEIILLLFLAAFLASGAMALQTGQALSDKVVRLHVLANSDSEEDQALKLLVRDQVLERAASLLEQAGDRRQAEMLLRQALPELEEAAAREIARVLRFPTAMKVESFSKGRLELVEYRVKENSALDGVQLLNLYKSLCVRVLICAVSRKGETIIPSGDFVLQSGDKIYLTSSPEQLAQFFRQLGVFRNKASSVMIVGASKICYYLASELLGMGMSVKIIDRDETRCIQMAEQLPKALVIVGDGTDTDLLHEEGIGQTDAFVAITGIDEANILMSICAAKESGDCKVIAKINRKALVDLVSNESMIDSVVSASSTTTELIVQYVRAMESASGAKIKTLHRLVDGEVEALEFGVPADAPFIGVPLKDLKLRNGLLLAGIVRQNGRIVIPSGMDALYAHDDVIVVTTDTTLQDIHDILR